MSPMSPMSRTTLDVGAVAAHLLAGGLACFPTETVWSLSCRADDPAAVARVFAAKQRPGGVPLAVGVASWADAAGLVEVTPLAERLAQAFLPGPLSLVLRRRGDALAHLAPGLATLSIRVPDHALAHELLRRTGPLVMTSANRHGEPDPDTAAGVGRALAGVEGLLVLGDQRVPGLASTVVDATGEAPVVLREGAVSRQRIRAAITG